MTYALVILFAWLSGVVVGGHNADDSHQMLKRTVFMTLFWLSLAIAVAVWGNYR